jgi:hypothetical protein
MTAPVINGLSDEQLTTSFVMPKKYSLEDGDNELLDKMILEISFV